jgi:alkaline phosphatase D
VLKGALASAGLAFAGPLVRAGHGATRFPKDPFSLGVASGSPLPDGVVLWTRLAPEPLLGGGMPPEPLVVDWEVAHDERFARVARAGRALATPEWAHSLHVEVQGLEPGRWYFYRFRAGDATSPVGRTRTAPLAAAPLERLRLGLASCAHYEQGYFSAYRHMAKDDLDLVLHVGDYIYESSWGRVRPRRHGAPEPMTLDDYRERYALYKSDPDLQAAHAACPWLVTWDDHEVDNDYAGERSMDLDPPRFFLERRAAAYRACYEHQPMRRGSVPFGPDMRIYGQHTFGRDVSLFLLDDRQYRSPQLCPYPGRGGSAFVESCAGLEEASRTLLGAEQEAWLAAGLARSQARFTLIAQQTLVAPIDSKPGPGERRWTDGWDGYPAARRRLLDGLAAKRNPIVLGGDVHAFWVSDLEADFSDPASKVIASEFVGSSITADSGQKQAEADAILTENPHLRFADVERHGYLTLELLPDRARADLKAVSDITDPQATLSTIASFVVEDGRPGPQRA